MENNQERENLKLLIDALRAGEIGLNDSRNALLARVPQQDDWAAFRHCTNPEDLVWLAAKTGDAFALFQDETHDILFHGLKDGCTINRVMLELLAEKQIRLVAVCNPGELVPEIF